MFRAQPDAKGHAVGEGEAEGQGPPPPGLLHFSSALLLAFVLAQLNPALTLALIFAGAFVFAGYAARALALALVHAHALYLAAISTFFVFGMCGIRHEQAGNGGGDQCSLHAVLHPEPPSKRESSR